MAGLRLVAGCALVRAAGAMGGSDGKLTSLFTGKLELFCVGEMMCYVLIFTVRPPRRDFLFMKSF